MGESMVERAAQAIAEMGGTRRGVWSTLGPKAKERYRTDVRAALTAIREPTEAMIRSGLDAFLEVPNHFRDGREIAAVWRSGIDAALSEEPPHVP